MTNPTQGEGVEPSGPADLREPAALIAPEYFPGRARVEREDGLYFKARPKVRWTAKLKNRRVIMAHDGDLWAVWFKTLVNRKERKISTVDFCMSEEAMEAFLRLHTRICLDEHQQARSARPLAGTSSHPLPSTPTPETP